MFISFVNFGLWYEETVTKPFNLELKIRWNKFTVDMPVLWVENTVKGKGNDLVNKSITLLAFCEHSRVFRHKGCMSM